MAITKHLHLVSAPTPSGGRISTARWITLCVIAMCIIGVIMVGSASSVISMSLYGSPWSILLRELLWVVVGTIAFTLFARIDIQRCRRWIPASLYASYGLLLCALVPGLGISSGGSSRWIGYGPLRIQPSEFMKLTLALYIANLIANKQDAGVALKRILGPVVAATGGAVVLVMKQPDLGTAMVLMVVLLSILVAAGVPGKILAKGVFGVATLVTILSLVAPYRVARLTSFVNPWGHATTTGYQVVQSMIGLGSGHLMGLGLGNSREKWGLLPNSHTDFIASVIGEELGLIGIVVVLCLIGFLISKGFRAATEAPDRFTTYLAAGLIAWIGAEAIINVGAALDVLPVTGIPLPFISFGGSSLVITLAASGLLVNIARQSVRQGTRSQRPVAKSASAPAKARSKSVSTARKAAPSSKRPGTKSSNSKTTTAATRSARPSARRRAPAPSTRQRKAR
jgi:cell division protein FtsW